MNDLSNLKGIMGKILWVNLTNKEIKEEIVPEEIYRKYLGGYGLGIHYIYSNLPKDCDPLGEDNILGFCPGLFTGSVAPFTGRYMVCGKSPLTGKGKKINGEISTGGWGDSNSGGNFGPAIKRAGYDAIFIKGISEKPVYLLIDDNHKEILDASDIWGKDVVETENYLAKKHGTKYKVASIGRGGENLSLIAGIVNDKGRIAARSGLGAVMGSKKLKALCIQGSKKIEYYDKKKAQELAKWYRDNINKYSKQKIVGKVVPIMPKIANTARKSHIPLNIAGKMGGWGVSFYVKFFKNWGTPYFYNLCAMLGDAPVKNYKGSYKDYQIEHARKLDFEKYLPYVKKNFGCFGCPIQCGAILEVPQLMYDDKEMHRPEYETIASFGTLILNDDLDTLLNLNEFLNREGIDTISAGTVIAFVHECVEKGILKKEDFICKEYPDGFLPEWGKSEYILPILNLMVTREGIGDKLADGVKEASKKIPNSEDFAAHSSGQEPAMHDGRYLPGLLLNYVADPTPGRHTSGSIDFHSMGQGNMFLKGFTLKNSDNPIKKGRIQPKASSFKAAFNSLGFCEFSIWCGEYPVLEMLHALTGWDMSVDELINIGKRIQIMRHLFNAREGAVRHEIPKRLIGDPPLEEGPNKGKSIDIETMVREYYKAMGLDETGVPLEETLKSVGLDDKIKDLELCTGVPEFIKNEYLLNKKK